MLPRERLTNLFRGDACRENVVCLHTWGRYVFEHFRRSELWDHSKSLGGPIVAEAYLNFIRDFPIDWIHVIEAWGGRHERHEDGTQRQVPDMTRKVAFPPWLGPLDLGNVDAHYDALDAQPWIDNGNFEHVSVLSREVGREQMIFPNIGGPCGELDADFEEALVRAKEDPAKARNHLLAQCRGWAFGTVKAARRCGADGFIFSLGYGGAMDVISPDMTRSINLDPWIEFFQQQRRIGLLPIGYFLGNVHPYMELIIETKPAGVMLEESKKGFILDPVEIRKRLPDEIVLFGNVDSLLLWKGTPREIEAAVKRQAAARDYGPFVFMNGSPICPETPVDNLRAFLDAARSV